jgi:hypothetical protein
MKNSNQFNRVVSAALLAGLLLGATTTLIGCPSKEQAGRAGTEAGRMLNQAKENTGEFLDKFSNTQK